MGKLPFFILFVLPLLLGLACGQPEQPPKTPLTNSAEAPEKENVAVILDTLGGIIRYHKGKLSLTGFKEFPIALIMDYKGAESLTLRKNSFPEIPAEAGVMDSLRRVRVAEQRLVPSGLSHFKSLEDLHILNCKVFAPLFDLQKIRQLKSLALVGNLLPIGTEVDVRGFRQLGTLVVENNRMKSQVKGLGDLDSLRSLRMDYPLPPDGIEQLYRFEHLKHLAISKRGINTGHQKRLTKLMEQRGGHLSWNK